VSVRVRRTLRRLAPAPLRVTERDSALLEALGRMKHAATRQLARLAFGQSRSAANKRLRRLLDAGLIRAWVPRLDGENVYGLTPRGARLLGEPPAGTSAWPTPRGLDGNLQHLLELGSVRIALAVTLAEAGLVLEWWRSYWELQVCFRESVIPDALFRVTWGGRGQVFALELDRTTPAAQAFVRRILRYEALEGRAYGVSGFTLLVVGGQAGWLERYRQRLAQHPLRTPVWFATLAEVEGRGIQASWCSTRGEQIPSLRALLPVRKGRGGEVGDEIAG